jgi:hypothetical protein
MHFIVVMIPVLNYGFFKIIFNFFIDIYLVANLKELFEPCLRDFFKINDT